MIPLGGKVAGIAVAAAACAYAGWSLNGVFADRAMATVVSEHASAVAAAADKSAKAIGKVLDEERGLRADAERIASDARTNEAVASAAAAGLDAVAAQLRDDIKRRNQAGSCATSADPRSATGGKTSAAAGVVPGDGLGVMLAEGADAARFLAPALDAAIARGATCEALYEAARERLRRIGESGRAVAVD